ncbi:MAG: single-stranded DNA-binding protein [Coriobacteriales bacterium]|nr:single-stranded DNA-binding protein [Coriobacteriales bacterium]
MSVNRVVISGNLTRDPELRSSQSGTNILTFGMAVNDRRRNPQTGEWEDYANFVDCVLFGNRAEWLSRDLHKGKKVFVEGKLRYSTWERDGQRRSKLEVVVDDIDYDRPPRQQGGYVATQQTQPAPAYNASAPAPVAQAPQQGGYAPQQNVQPTQSQPVQPSPVVSAPPQADVYDEDIPF